MERTIILFTHYSSNRTTVMEAFGDTKVPTDILDRVRAVVEDFTKNHSDWDNDEIIRIASRVLGNMGYSVQSAGEDYKIFF